MTNAAIFLSITIVAIVGNTDGVNARWNSMPSTSDLGPCITCLNNIGGPLEALLYVVGDRSTTASCDRLCPALAQRDRSYVNGAFCDLVCQAFGIETFVRTVTRADLNPFRFCQLARLCPGKTKHIDRCLELLRCVLGP